MGRVEVYDRNSDQWGTVCYDDVINNNYYVITSLVCNSRYFGGYYAFAFGPANLSYNIQPSTNNPVVSEPIDCGIYSDVYDYFYQCPSFQLNATAAMSRCTPDQEWVIVCHCKLMVIVIIITSLCSYALLV